MFDNNFCLFVVVFLAVKHARNGKSGREYGKNSC